MIELDKKIGDNMGILDSASSQSVSRGYDYYKERRVVLCQQISNYTKIIMLCSCSLREETVRILANGFACRTRPDSIRHPGSCRPFPYIRVRESLGVDKILTGSNP